MKKGKIKNGVINLKELVVVVKKFISVYCRETERTRSVKQNVINKLNEPLSTVVDARMQLQTE